MATTSPDNIWTQDSADNYDLVVDAAATATSIQTALVARANSYKGTTAQRTAFTATAPEGTTWADTNGEKILWIKQGAVWVRVWPQEYVTPAIQTGIVSVTPIANTVVPYTVTFPVAFTTTPRVVVTANSSVPHAISLGATGVSTTQFTLQTRRTSTSAYSVFWIAIAGSSV